MTQGKPSGRWVRRLHAVLLRAWPRAFRDRFGGAMSYAFERDLEAAHRKGWLHVAVFCLRTALTTPVLGLLERASIPGRGADPARDPPPGSVGRPWGGGGETMGDLVRELRHGARSLLRRPGFTIPAVVALALGIGGTTAMFTVVDGVVLRPLPYPGADRLVVVGHRSPTSELALPAAGYLHYRERSRTMADLALYLETSSAVTTLDEPLELGIVVATPNLLPLLGVEPVLGRGFTPQDTEPGAPPVALVTHGYWTRWMGADPDAVGGPLTDGDPTLVVGVLPPGFGFLRPDPTVAFGNPFDAPDVFVPLERFDPAGQRFGNFIYQGLARLTPGATVEEAQAELDALILEAVRAFPGGIDETRIAAGEYVPTVEGFSGAVVGDVAGVLWILMAAVALVLLISVGNVANLVLVRTESRSAEIAIRTVMGAGRRSLARAFLAEGAVLAVLGGGLGVVLAAVGTRALLRLAPVDLPRVSEVGLDLRAWAVAVVLSLAAGLACGLVPAMRGRGRPLQPALGDGARGGTAGRRRVVVRNALVGSQVALALVLLVASGLLLRTFANLRDVDPGFDPDGVLTFRLSLPGSVLTAAGYGDGPGDVRRSRYMLELTDRLEAVPGVERAAFSGDLPLDGAEFHDFVATEDAYPAEQAQAVRALRVFMGPGYLATLGAALRSGREFDRQDFAEQPRVAVVNEAFARQRWPGLDPVGRRLAQYWSGSDPSADIWYTVVGVVEDVTEASLVRPPEPTVYLPTVFLPEDGFSMFVSNLVAVVRTEPGLDPAQVLPAVREEVRAFQAVVPVNDIETLAALTARSFQDVSFAMTLVLIAALTSLLLGLTGIYGTVLFVVGRRTREFGVRMALGASGSHILRGVLWQSGRVAVVGIVVGVLAARAVSGVLASLLYGVTATDPVVYALVAGALLALVLAASAVPARRAAAVDPTESMRAE